MPADSDAGFAAFAWTQGDGTQADGGPRGDASSQVPLSQEPGLFTVRAPVPAPLHLLLVASLTPARRAVSCHAKQHVLMQARLRSASIVPRCWPRAGQLIACGPHWELVRAALHTTAASRWR